MKLSEPQRRVLRTIWQYKWHIQVIARENGSWSTYWVRADFNKARFVRQPNTRTLQSLERRGLLERDREGRSIFNFVLTPKGRKVAKELQDA